MLPFAASLAVLAGSSPGLDRRRREQSSGGWPVEAGEMTVVAESLAVDEAGRSDRGRAWSVGRRGAEGLSAAAGCIGCDTAIAHSCIAAGCF